MNLEKSEWRLCLQMPSPACRRGQARRHARRRSAAASRIRIIAWMSRASRSSLRICGEGTELVGVNRDAEYIASQAAGQLGIAPQVFYRILPESYLVTRFINGQPVPPEAMGKPENIVRVAEAIRQFHALPLTLPVNFFAIPPRGASDRGLGAATARAFPGILTGSSQRMREVGNRVPDAIRSSRALPQRFAQREFSRRRSPSGEWWANPHH